MNDLCTILPRPRRLSGMGRTISKDTATDAKIIQSQVKPGKRGPPNRFLPAVTKVAAQYQDQGRIKMSRKFNFKLVALCTILSAMLVVPALGQGNNEGGQFKERKAQMIKQLKLSPDKEKAALAMEEKYSKERQEIIAGMKKANTDLAAAVKVTPQDESKIKGLVSAITSGQDKLFASFKNQRDEELALMTPGEQGNYLLAMGNWRQEMMKKVKESGKKK